MERKGLSAAILSGGLGTRLRPVVADRPKVLAEVAGKPFLAYLLDRLIAADIAEVTLLVGFAADQVRAAFGDSYRGVPLRYSREPEPLGTGGALRLALPLLAEETILLLNGDSFCELDYESFFASRRDVTLALAHVPDASRYGRVIGPDLHSPNPESQILSPVTGFAEKSPDPSPGWINAGVYLLPRSVVATIPTGRAVSLERDVLPPLVAQGRVRGFPAGRFIDIGTPESYAAAEAFFRTPPTVTWNE
jgi:NDP-sugar pyrophosphorylase family protein